MAKVDKDWQNLMEFIRLMIIIVTMSAIAIMVVSFCYKGLDYKLNTMWNPFRKKEKVVFDWAKFINDVNVGNLHEYPNCLRNAYDWKTCPVGQLPKEIPRFKSGKPTNDTLTRLGVNFAINLDILVDEIKSLSSEKHMVQMTRQDLKNILSMIEKRSAEILKQTNP